MPDRTDTDAVIELANEHATRKPIVLSDMDGDMGVLAVPLPPGWTLAQVDTEPWAERPRRPKGTIQVHDAAGFTRSVRRRAVHMIGGDNDGLDLVLYANEETKQLVAVLNDDAATASDLVADWRDYRVELALRPRPEWTHWKGADGKYLEQEPFAEHIEHGLPELVSPPAADALELAQTFTATIGARFKSGTRLATGVTQFTYEEEVDAKAGASGLLDIPTELVLNVAPFFGAPKYEVTARFRYRLPRGGGSLTLGYLLNRPGDVERAAFNDVVTAVATELGVDPVAGVAPAAR